MTLYPLFRNLLFKLEPERAHQLTLNLVRLAGEIGPLRWFIGQLYKAPPMPVQAFGLNFINPIGLASGYDKDGLGWRGLAALGFGHIEVGTVTVNPQPGNPKPRLFRLKEEKALINRMGFPGRGEEFVRQKLARSTSNPLVLGVNIGKNKDTPLEEAAEDYVHLLRTFAPLADYLAINISSPNTVGLRRLQERQALEGLIRQIYIERERLQAMIPKIPPLLVKLAPDLSDLQLDDILEVLMASQVDGVIATNTTLSREGVKSSLAGEVGGLSGVPLFASSLEIVRKISQRTGNKLPIIGVGGINNADGVRKMLDAGAVLVQIYTGLVYKGPGLVQRILFELQK